MIKVTVDRKTWLRGEGPSKSALLRADGKMCCLGFASIQCGYTAEQILDKKTPVDACNEIKKLDFGVVKKLRAIGPDADTMYPPEFIRIIDDSIGCRTRVHNELVSNMMTVNDRELEEESHVPIEIDGEDIFVTTEEIREHALVTLGRKVGLELEFID